jgi:2-beta-glucuronyltransferase
LADDFAEQRRKIVILTSHVFLRGYRKASIHFVARKWAERGHQVRFVTIGHSWLTYLKDRPRFEALRHAQANRFETVEPNLEAGAYLPPLHAFSSNNPLLNRLNEYGFHLYGAYLPPFARRAVTEADLVVIESGSALSFFDHVKALNPRARTLYFCRDLLRSVGAAPVLQRMQNKAIDRFDVICVPSQRLGAMLPEGGKIRFIPQGVDTALFDRDYASPYQPGSRNAVSVGNMLFDQAAMDRMVAAAPDVTFHIFGAVWRGSPAPNIVVYGERDFESIVPYIRHADIGLAPYRLTPDEVYLAESSLKLSQYSYCRLPILLPDLIPYARPNGVAYRLDGETDWRGRIEAALLMPHSPGFSEGILTWSDVAARTFQAAFE